MKIFYELIIPKGYEKSIAIIKILLQCKVSKILKRKTTVNFKYAKYQGKMHFFCFVK